MLVAPVSGSIRTRSSKSTALPLARSLFARTVAASGGGGKLPTSGVMARCWLAADAFELTR